MVTNLLFPKQFAKAILSCYANKPATISCLVKQNHQLINLLQTYPQVKNYFQDLTILKESKKTTLKELLKLMVIEKSFANGLYLFIDNGHSPFFFQLLQAIDRYGLIMLSTKKAQVISAVGLTNQQKQVLQQAWEKKINQPIYFEYVIDPDLILGIKVRVDDYVEEYSLASHLHQLKTFIKQQG